LFEKNRIQHRIDIGLNCNGVEGRIVFEKFTRCWRLPFPWHIVLQPVFGCCLLVQMRIYSVDKQKHQLKQFNTFHGIIGGMNRTVKNMKKVHFFFPPDRRVGLSRVAVRDKKLVSLVKLRQEFLRSKNGGRLGP